MNAKAVFLLCVFGLSAQAGAVDELLRDAIVKAHAKTLERFSNGHFVWTYESAQGDSVTKTRYELWARGGTHYRLDQEETKDGLGPDSVLRDIVVPEGFVEIVAKDRQDAGAIVDFGPAEKGVKYIVGQHFVARGIRVASETVESWLQGWESKNSDLNLVSLNLLSEPPVTTLSHVREYEEGTAVYTAEMEGNDYRIVRGTYRFDSVDGTQWATNTFDFFYGEDTGGIPLKTIRESDGNFGKPLNDKLILESYDWEPAPLEVFSIAEAGIGTAGAGGLRTRRLVVLFIGLLFVGAWLYSRLRRPGTA